MFIICLQAEFHLLGSSGSLVTAITPTPTENNPKAAMLLLHHETHYFNVTPSVYLAICLSAQCYGSLRPKTEHFPIPETYL